MYGNFFENGPFWLNSTKSKTGSGYQENPRDITWAQNYNMLFVDQPIGTGGSYANDTSFIPTNQQQVADQFYNALQNIFSLDTNFDNNPCSLLAFIENSTDVYVMGESYAGKYVPAIGYKIIQQNIAFNASKGNVPFRYINLRGISIGDGFTDPETITRELTAFSYNLGLIDF